LGVLNSIHKDGFLAKIVVAMVDMWFCNIGLLGGIFMVVFLAWWSANLAD